MDKNRLKTLVQRAHDPNATPEEREDAKRKLRKSASGPRQRGENRLR